MESEIHEMSTRRCKTFKHSLLRLKLYDLKQLKQQYDADKHRARIIYYHLVSIKVYILNINDYLFSPKYFENYERQISRLLMLIKQFSTERKK